ncbi:MAG: hypothetical protein KGL02_14885, partial [Acidobacteriota bacterium]|nr:hypothetical protein [Acidobacteriota bacterium]
MAPRPRISRKITVATALGLTEAAAHSPHVPGALISCEGGKERLVVRLTSPGGKPQLFDFTPHLHRRDLAVNFADAFYGWGVAQSATTRLRKKPFLDRFFEYLDEIEARGPSVQPIERLDQLTTHLFNGYVAWLNEPKLRTRGPLRGKRKPWTVKSRSVHFGIVSCIVDWLKNYRPDRLPDDCELPWAPWPGVERKVTPTKILTPQQVAQIEAACIAEIDCTWRRFQLGRQLLSRRSEQPGGHDSELIALLQFIHLEHGDVVKNVAALPNRWSALIATRGGSEALHTFLCATVRSLIPYAILIVSRGFFNTEAVLGANRNVVEDDPLFDERQVVWLDKGRSTKNQRRSFDARRSHAVPNLIEQVLELTEPLLKHVCGTPLERRLFIFKGGRGSKEPVLSFIDINGVLDSHLWTDNLKRFRERHSLPYFTLHMLRKTGSDRVHEATGGNLKAVQKLLGQANPDV